MIGKQCRLMTEPDTPDLLFPTCPRSDRLEVVDNEIVLLYGKCVNLFDYFPGAVEFESLVKINSPGLPKVKTQTLRFVFYREWKRNLGLCAANKKIDLSEFPEFGNNVHRSAQMAVAGALNSIEDLHFL